MNMPNKVLPIQNNENQDELAGTLNDLCEQQQGLRPQ